VVCHTPLQPNATVSAYHSIDVPFPVLVHDIAITANHTLLFDPNFQVGEP
jgi:carotenoid cleavage dioxygenase-like enzyme